MEIIGWCIFAIFAVIWVVVMVKGLFILPIQISNHKKYMEKVICNLNSNSADDLMKFISKNGCPNLPEQWNQLRGAWNAINNCPQITTEKKTMLRDFLMVKGLRLTGNDKNINDNYGKNQTKATH